MRVVAVAERTGETPTRGNLGAEEYEIGFDPAGSEPEVSGAEDPVALDSLWPGVLGVLPGVARVRIRIVHCRGIRIAGSEKSAMSVATDEGSDIYLSRAISRSSELKVVLGMLRYSGDELVSTEQQILRPSPPPAAPPPSATRAPRPQRDETRIAPHEPDASTALEPPPDETRTAHSPAAAPRPATPTPWDSTPVPVPPSPGVRAPASPRPPVRRATSRSLPGDRAQTRPPVRRPAEAKPGSSRPAGWIPKGGNVVFEGRDLGGMVYFGPAPHSSRQGSPDNAWIDPRMPVTVRGRNRDGDGIPLHWPNYSTLDGRSRATYLDWLAGGRSDPDIDARYVRLYFFGLERRFFVDHPEPDERADLVAEVRRLLDAYGEDSSLRHVIESFLDAASLLEPGGDFEPMFDPGRVRSEVPVPVRVGLGRMAARGEPLTSDWLLSWFVCHPSTDLPGAAERVFPEFRACFRDIFEKRYPNGLKLHLPKRPLKIEYRAASGTFAVDLAVSDARDVSGLSKPLRTAEGIAELAGDELDRYSRYLARNPDARGTTAAHTLLPDFLRPLFPCPEKEDFHRSPAPAESGVDADATRSTPVVGPVVRVDERTLTLVSDEEDPVSLDSVWPGFRRVLPDSDLAAIRIVRCRRIRIAGRESMALSVATRQGSDIYLSRGIARSREPGAILGILGFSGDESVHAEQQILRQSRPPAADPLRANAGGGRLPAEISRSHPPAPATPTPDDAPAPQPPSPEDPAPEVASPVAPGKEAVAEAPEPAAPRPSVRRPAAAPESGVTAGYGWAPRSGNVHLHGRDIGGLVYFGPPPRKGHHGPPENVWIDPAEEVGADGGNRDGPGTPVRWSSYSTLDDRSRAAYLDWLASGRSDPRIDARYVLLYFYGLEWRVFGDRAEQTERADIIAEVRRLLDTYGEDSSLRRVLDSFLDAASLLDPDEDAEPTFDPGRGDIPARVRRALGLMVVRGEPLTSDWLLSWFVCHPSRNLPATAEGAFPEFRASFRHLFEQRYPDGLTIRAPKKRLRIGYRAASGNFEKDLTEYLDGARDVSVLSGALFIAEEIARSAADGLERYSRYLARNPDGRGTIAAHSLLPEFLRPQFPCPESEGISAWARKHIESRSLVRAAEVFERLKVGRRRKGEIYRLLEAADLLGRLGVGVVPDPRFALAMPQPQQPVVLFRLPEGARRIGSPSDAYRRAILALAVGTGVARVDGRISPRGRAHLTAQIDGDATVSEAERARLAANLVWMGEFPPDLSLLTRKLREAPRGDRDALARAAIAAAAADGAVGPAKLRLVQRLHAAMGRARGGSPRRPAGARLRAGPGGRAPGGARVRYPLVVAPAAAGRSGPGCRAGNRGGGRHGAGETNTR